MRRAGGEPQECPVCLEGFTVEDGRARVAPFACAHATCQRCDVAMFERADDRCPLCRSDRTPESRRSQSAQSQVLHNTAAQQRRSEEPEQSLVATIFFPASSSIDSLTLEQALAQIQEHMRASPFDTISTESSLTSDASSGSAGHAGSARVTIASSHVDDPAIVAAVNALTHVTGTPLRAFSRVVSRLRRPSAGPRASRSTSA